MAYEQEPPFAIQVEMVEGCNLRCTFCGLNGIRGKENNFKFLTLETAERIASEIARCGWTSRIEFAMHGEPTMNPQCLEIIATFRRLLPRHPIMMTSNGGGLLKGAPFSMLACLDAGLDTLAIDEYQDIPIVGKLKKSICEQLGLESLKGIKSLKSQSQHGDGKDIHLFNYPDDDDGNPHQRKSYKRLIFIRPINLNTSGTHASLNNHAGAGAPKDWSQAGKRCAKPFRELSFRWDGGIAICCNDWRGDYVIGNITNTPLEQLWLNERFAAARKKLYHGQRDFGPCDGCNATSYRLGLLPDKKGKEALPEASADDYDVIAAALADGPLTQPIKRPWENN